MPISEAYLIDCMEYMRTVPDKFFELAVVDPIFREDNQPTQTMRGFNLEMKSWNLPPGADYFEELFRISMNQIIMGGNYFAHSLPENNNWIVWYKNNDGVGFSMAELFWCSIQKNVKVYELRPMGTNGIKIHPTQKPVSLYKWLLRNYAKPGDKIFDSYMGSQSSRIAAWDGGFDYWGCELDPDYFRDGCKRFERHKRQLDLFKPQPSHPQPESHTAQSVLF